MLTNLGKFFENINLLFFLFIYFVIFLLLLRFYYLVCYYYYYLLEIEVFEFVIKNEVYFAFVYYVYTVEVLY